MTQINIQEFIKIQMFFIINLGTLFHFLNWSCVVACAHNKHFASNQQKHMEIETISKYDNATFGIHTIIAR